MSAGLLQPTPTAFRQPLLWLTAVMALLVGAAGCASHLGSAPVLQRPGEATVPASPSARAPAKSTPRRQDLQAEQQRFEALFRGTPVVFSMQADGSLQVTVPLRYSFDVGRSAVKPPLGAVLDRIGTSQAAEPSRLVVSAPGDTNARSTALALARAVSARDYLVSRGVSASRLSVATAAPGSPLTLVITQAPPL